MVKVSRRIAIVNLIFFIVMIAINYYAGSNVRIIANEISALIQPAGYAFSIWILIFFLLFLWVVKGFFVRSKKASVYIDTQRLIPINFLLNGAWGLDPSFYSAKDSFVYGYNSSVITLAHIYL